MKDSDATLGNAGLILCLTCDRIIEDRRKSRTETLRCPRCGSKVERRIPSSVSHTWAFVITGFLLLIPANICPIAQVVRFGSGDPDTILSGVMGLLRSGMIPIAVIVFVASIVVPIFKLMGLTLLLLCVQFRWRMSPFACTLMYRFISLIGRWSMLDLFMISILSALVDMGAVSSVVPGPGATAFASVVVVTLFASISFDPRLIWDLKESSHGRKEKAPTA
jgi:paraquat-inducible protein A